MEKHLKDFTYLVFFLGFLCATHSTVTAVTKNTRTVLPWYAASGVIHNHGITLDAMSAIRYQRQSLWYGSVQIHTLYTGFGSLLSVGSGYRTLINAQWLLGGYLHLEGGLLPNDSGCYTKLNLGFEAQALKKRLGCNFYVPLKFASSLLNYDELTLKDFTGHKECSWHYLEQDQLGFDIAGDMNIVKAMTAGLGVYGAQQSHNSFIIGSMIRSSYQWNDLLSFQCQYSFDSFRGHYLTLGARVRHTNRSAVKSQRHQQLWSPLDRHIAPIQMLYRSDNHFNEVHCHFDSRLKSAASTEASYENPCPRLNNAILQKLREQHYPSSPKKIVLHLSGFFDLGDGTEVLLKLKPFEHIQGETCHFDHLKHFGFKDNNGNVLQLNSDEFKLRPQNAGSSENRFDKPVPADLVNKQFEKKLPSELVVEASGVMYDTDHQLEAGAMLPSTYRILKSLVHNEKVLDGRAILRGAVALNNNTSVSNIAILPADETKKSNEHIKAHDDLSAAGHKTEQDAKVFYRQAYAVVVPKQEDKSPVQNVTLQNLVISGWPQLEERYQYHNGIEVTFCEHFKMHSVWINQTQTAIAFNSVKQLKDTDITNIYIGHPTITSDINCVGFFKNSLSCVMSQVAQNKIEAAEHLHQKMVAGLKTKKIYSKELFKHVKGIDVKKLPEVMILKDLDIESRVLIGVHAQNSNVKRSFNIKKPHTVTDKIAWSKKLGGAYHKMTKGVTGFFAPSSILNQQQQDLLNSCGLSMSDGLIMARILPIFIRNQSNGSSHEKPYMQLQHFILGSQYLGGYVENAKLILEGSTNRDNFVYINSTQQPSEISATAEKIALIEPITKQWGTALPNSFCLENTDKDTLNVGIIALNTGVLMALSNDHWMHKQAQFSHYEERFLLCSGKRAFDKTGSAFGVISLPTTSQPNKTSFMLNRNAHLQGYIDSSQRKLCPSSLSRMPVHPAYNSQLPKTQRYVRSTRSASDVSPSKLANTDVSINRPSGLANSHSRGYSEAAVASPQGSTSDQSVVNALGHRRAVSHRQFPQGAQLAPLLLTEKVEISHDSYKPRRLPIRSRLPLEARPLAMPGQDVLTLTQQPVIPKGHTLTFEQAQVFPKLPLPIAQNDRRKRKGNQSDHENNLLRKTMTKETNQSASYQSMSHFSNVNNQQIKPTSRDALPLPRGDILNLNPITSTPSDEQLIRAPFRHSLKPNSLNNSNNREGQNVNRLKPLRGHTIASQSGTVTGAVTPKKAVCSSTDHSLKKCSVDDTGVPNTDASTFYTGSAESRSTQPELALSLNSQTNDLIGPVSISNQSVPLSHPMQQENCDLSNQSALLLSTASNNNISTCTFDSRPAIEQVLAELAKCNNDARQLSEASKKIYYQWKNVGLRNTMKLEPPASSEAPSIPILPIAYRK